MLVSWWGTSAFSCTAWMTLTSVECDASMIGTTPSSSINDDTQRLHSHAMLFVILSWTNIAYDGTQLLPPGLLGPGCITLRHTEPLRHDPSFLLRGLGVRRLVLHNASLHHLPAEGIMAPVSWSRCQEPLTLCGAPCSYHCGECGSWCTPSPSPGPPWARQHHHREP